MRDKKNVLQWIILFVIGVYLISGLGYFVCFYISPIGYFIPILAPIIWGGFVIGLSGKTINIHYRDHILMGSVIGSGIPSIYVVILALGIIGIKGSMEGNCVTIAFVFQNALIWLFAAICEEVGWRGVLFPLLRKITGYWQSCVAVGIIWYGWHLPLILKGELLGAFSSLQAMFLFFVEIMSLTFIMGAVSKTQYGYSIWPFIMMHAIHNLLIRVLVEYVGKEWSWLVDDGGYLLNLILIIFAISINICVTIRQKKCNEITIK